MDEEDQLRALSKKLARLTPRELQTRAWQEISKRADLLRSHLGIQPSASRQLGHPKFHARFFFSTVELPGIVDVLTARFPKEAAAIVRQAESICRHRFDLLGYEGLEYGAEIDWHLDAASGKRARRRPWFQIPYLDFDEVGDSKVIWELNRHQHLVTLAKGYRLTNDTRYSAEIVNQWHHWQQENPYPMGINWASSLEVAFRTLSWLWVRELLAGSSAVSELFLAELEREFAVNARHIEKYLSTYFSPNTHLLGEGVALFFVGTLCPQFAASRRWRRKGWQIVLEASSRQVRSDGMHFEQSTYYHVYALDFFLHARILAAANGVEIPPAFDETLVRMLEFLAVLGQTGAVSRLGDDDGGRLFDSRRNRTEHLLDPLSTGTVLFGRKDFKTAVGSLREETLWLLGKQAVETFDSMPEATPQCHSRSFPESGIYVLASPFPSPHQLVLDAGPHGTGSAGHGHADALSVQLSACGREWLTDPGTGVYVSGDSERDRFRGTSAHNTLQVDAKDQAEPATTFKWRQILESRVERSASSDSFDLVAASHTGYLRLAEPVIHRRWVFHLKGHFFLVRDVVEGKGTHELDIHWHLGPEISAQESTGLFRLCVPGSEMFLLLPVDDPSWAVENRKGSISPAYGQRSSGDILRFSCCAGLPTEFAVLLFPNGIEEGPTEFVRLPAACSSGIVSAYRYRVGRDVYSLFFSGDARAWKYGEWTSDAEFVFCSTSPEGGLERLILVGGSSLERNGIRLLLAHRTLNHWEWKANAAQASDADLVGPSTNRERSKAV